MAWLTDWTYRKRIYLNATSVSVTNYQVRLRVGESSGSSGYDFHLEGHASFFPSQSNNSGDIRFTDADGNLIDFYVQKVVGSEPNRTATIWVKIPSDLSTPTLIYCYYHNPNLSDSSSTETYFLGSLLFDDELLAYGLDNTQSMNVSDPSVLIFVDNFSHDSIDYNYELRRILDTPTVSSIYDNNTTSFSFDTGESKSSTYLIKSVSEENFIIECDIECSGAYTDGGSVVLIGRYGNNDGYYTKFFLDEYSSDGNLGTECEKQSPILNWSEGVSSLIIFGGVIQHSIYTPSSNTYLPHNTSLTVKLGIYNDSIKLFRDDNLVLDTTDNTITGNGKVGFGVENLKANITSILVRNWVGEDATISSIGVEESENVEITDTITIVDNFLTDKPVSISDNINIVDYADGGRLISVSDTITLTDSIDVVKYMYIEDSIHLSDSILIGKYLTIDDTVSLEDNIIAVAPPKMLLTGGIHNTNIFNSLGYDPDTSTIYSDTSLTPSNIFNLFTPVTIDMIVNNIGETLYDYVVFAIYNRNTDPTTFNIYLDGQYTYTSTGYSERYELALGSTSFYDNNCNDNSCMIRLEDRHYQSSETLEFTFDSYNSSSPITIQLQPNEFRLLYIRRVIEINNNVDILTAPVNLNIELKVDY